MTKVLLVVSSDTAADEATLARGESPRRDYMELARLLDADVFDARSAKTGIGSRNGRVGVGLIQALKVVRHVSAYDIVYTDNERVGVFVGLLLRLRRVRPVHVMLGHHLSPAKKRPLLRLARRGIDRLLVHSPCQKELALEQLGFSKEQVDVLPYQVDAAFWRPLGRPPRNVICSAGLECRDYPTLIKAVEGLPLDVKIGAASYWSAKRSRIEGELPPNVEVRPFTYTELRQLYDRSRFVVVPLLDVDFQAGITLILEAMAMAKAVIVTKTLGLPESVKGPEWTANLNEWPKGGPAAANSSGIFVPPNDAWAMRSAISYLLAHPDVATILGANGRKLAEESYSLSAFATRFASAILRPVDGRSSQRFEHVARG
jgi:glycosyltransferase involved in cell wall biosynthesis